MSSKAKEPVTAAERMRRLRTRRRNGLRYMPILLHETEIDSLIDRGFLKEERRHDRAAVQNAIDGFRRRAPRPQHAGKMPRRACGVESTAALFGLRKLEAADWGSIACRLSILGAQLECNAAYSRAFLNNSPSQSMSCARERLGLPFHELEDHLRGCGETSAQQNGRARLVDQHEMALVVAAFAAA
jgi:hypothetical protein